MYLCGIMVDKLSKEELEKLAQEADKEKVKRYWYLGKVFNGAIKLK